MGEGALPFPGGLCKGGFPLRRKGFPGNFTIEKKKPSWYNIPIRKRRGLFCVGEEPPMARALRPIKAFSLGRRGRLRCLPEMRRVEKRQETQINPIKEM